MDMEIGISETSIGNNGLTSWNSDYSYYIETDFPFFSHGGHYYDRSYSGSFAFNRTSGHSHYANGFRSVLVAE